MATQVKRRKAPSPITGLAAKIQQYLTLRVQADLLDSRVGELKKELSASIEADGYTDDKGHQWLDVDPITVDGFGTVKGLQRQRRVRQTLNVDAAEELLRAKGLWEDCSVVIEVVDEEAIRKAHFQGLLTDEDVEVIWPSTETWAFIPVKEGK